jgi:hypothetical protein
MNLVKDVKERDDLNLNEYFIDGASVIAKNGSRREKPSEARARGSWQWQTASIFLSPKPLEVLRRMKLS